MKRYLDRNRRLADYIYNDMDPEEMVMIESDLQNDAEFSESYLLNREVKDYLQAKLQLEEMRSDPQLEDAEKLADMAFGTESSEEEAQLTIPTGRRNRMRTISFAAAIAATATIIIAVGIVPALTNQDRLFDRYYEPIAASDFTQRGESNEIYRDIALGINDYLDGNYRQSIDQFGDLAFDPAIQSEVQFFTALSHLGLGQFQDAQNILKPLVDSDMRYQAEVLWYLSLCYLKTGASVDANTHLEQLENYDGMYKKDAQSLRKKLRRFE